MAVALKLYELSDQYNTVLEMMEESEDREALQHTLDALEGAFEQKAESIIKLWRQKCAERDFVKAERVRLEAQEKRIDKQAEWLKRYVEEQMKHTGIKNVRSPLFNISLQNNPVAVDVVDEAAVPEQFKHLIMEYKVDKKAIKEAIESGEEVPGAALRQDQSLRIR